MSGAHDSWWRQLGALAPTHRAIAVPFPPVPTLAELVSRSVGTERFRRTAIATGPGMVPGPCERPSLSSTVEGRRAAAHRSHRVDVEATTHAAAASRPLTRGWLP